MDASQIDHDGLFKALLREFVFEFLTLFFPKLAAATDPASLEFIATEIQVNLPDGRAQQADLVVKAKFMGSDIYFLVHVEHQSTPSREMPRRLFEYFSGFFLTHGLMIYPIVTGIRIREPIRLGTTEELAMLLNCMDLAQGRPRPGWRRKAG